MDQNTGRTAPPLRKTGLKSLPSLPQPPAAPGITFSRFGLLLGGAVVVAALGWAFFMGFMVGRGDNPSEQVAEATSFLRDGGQGKTAGDKPLATADAGQSATLSAGQTGEPAPLGQSGSLGATTGATTPVGSAQAPGNTASPATGMLSNHNGATAGANTAVTAPSASAPAFDPHARPQGDSLAAWGNNAGKAATQPVTQGAVKPQPQAGKKPQPATSKPAAAGPSYVFTYQLGAFKSKAAADAFQKKLAAKGQRSAVSQNGKVWLVTYQVRGTEDQARNTRLKLEQQGFGKALLTSRKPVK